MKEWERKQQQKIHNTRIKNAKATFQKGQKPPLPVAVFSPVNHAYFNKINNPIESLNITETPVYKLLKAFKLQQYAKVNIIRNLLNMDFMKT